MARSHVQGLNLIVAMIFLIIGVSEATDYVVGDSYGWNVPTNENFYMDWARRSHRNGGFFVGDNLIFTWTGEHTVAVVTSSDPINYYDNCNTNAVTVSPTFRSNNGSESYVYTISYPLGPHYFLCTVDDHCARGQKFSINAMDRNQYSSAVHAAPSLGMLFASLFALALCFFTRIR